MEGKGFFDEKQFSLARDKVFFESTREKKIERIKLLGCTHFIDDLAEVFLHKHFPDQVKKVLYQIGKSDEVYPCDWKVCSTWSDVSSAIFGSGFKQDLTIVAQSLAYPAEVVSCQAVEKGETVASTKLSYRVEILWL